MNKLKILLLADEEHNQLFFPRKKKEGEETTALFTQTMFKSLLDSDEVKD